MDQNTWTREALMTFIPFFQKLADDLVGIQGVKLTQWMSLFIVKAPYLELLDTEILMEGFSDKKRIECFRSQKHFRTLLLCPSGDDEEDNKVGVWNSDGKLVYHKALHCVKRDELYSEEDARMWFRKSQFAKKGGELKSTCFNGDGSKGCPDLRILNNKDQNSSCFTQVISSN